MVTVLSCSFSRCAMSLFVKTLVSTTHFLIKTSNPESHLQDLKVVMHPKALGLLMRGISDEIPHSLCVLISP